MLYGFSLYIINCLRVSKRMSEYNKSIFRGVDGKLSEYRCAHVLYIGYGDEHFVYKVSRLLYRIYLFVYDAAHDTSEGRAIKFE